MECPFLKMRKKANDKNSTLIPSKALQIYFTDLSKQHKAHHFICGVVSWTLQVESPGTLYCDEAQPCHQKSVSSLSPDNGTLLPLIVTISLVLLSYCLISPIFPTS